jgi:hypothetical protein
VLCFLLFAYAVLGRAGAHLGLPLGNGGGIYPGELVLLFGGACLVAEGSWSRFVTLAVGRVWLLFVAWNASRTLPYMPRYGVMAIRDGVMWEYSLFAVVVASQILARPSACAILLNRYAAFARFFAYVALIMAPVAILNPGGLLGFPAMEPQSVMPHLAGTTAFVVCGLATAPGAGWWWATAMGVILVGSQGRAVLIGFFAALGVVWLFNPWRLRIRLNVRNVGWIAGFGFVLATAMMLNLNFGKSSSGRVIGPNQLLENLESVFAETGTDALDGSRRMRFITWGKIIDYTLFGPYFWTGKGYGINLLDDAGVQVMAKDEIAVLPPGVTAPREPENSHLTFLARGGVTGLLLWVFLQVVWAGGMLRVVFFAIRTGRRRTVGFMSFLLAYWTYYLVAMDFGPSLEQPHNGIWFWTIFGVGAAAVEIVRRDPDLFERNGAGLTVSSGDRGTPIRYSPRSL